MTADWRQDDDRQPARFGRKARAWLRRRLKTTLFKEHDDRYRLEILGVDYDDATASDVVNWFLRNPLAYVEWIDAEHWHGSQFSNGHWQVNECAVRRDSVAAARAVDQERDAECYPTLDEWLRAEANGELWSEGHPGGMPNISAEEKLKTAAAMHARRMRRVCPCGARFTAKKRNAVHCDACRARARAEREKAPDCVRRMSADRGRAS